MSFTDYLEDKLLNHVLRNGTGGNSFPSPNIWIGLSTDVLLPTDSGTCSEVVGGGYARKYAAPADFNAPAYGTVTNASTITFNQATANWGTIAAFHIWDAGTGGNMLMYGTLVINKVIQSGDTPSFAAGDMKIALD